MSGLRVVAGGLLFAVTCAAMSAEGERSPAFKEFDRRAKAGERLIVVFFGASLTWGANASDPQLTSYRALIGRRLEEAYPQARFRFYDAAIGGTGSQLGVFRFEREVLRRKPDLVFLDFSANDDIYGNDAETLASYESLVRRTILDAKAPIVEVIFPFMWNVSGGSLGGMKRRDAHIAIGKAYNVPVGDAIALAQQRVKAKETTIAQLWPFDGVHPGDAGYVLFADAAWQAFQSGVEQGLVCTPPEKMLNPDTYMKNARVRISTLGELPQGWRVGVPNPVSAFFDMLMSRWLDDETIASNRKEVTENGKKKPVPQDVARLKVKFSGSMVMLYGEATPKSCKYRAYIDGKLVEHQEGQKKDVLQEFDGGKLSKLVKGNTHHAQVIATGLDPAIEHTLEIEPVFAADPQPLAAGDGEQELRLESICVAGGQATVR
ncbi:MAG: SGNH/GDSL hydrolase family protein [Planctomycetota bacterium]|nr:SGNH/GDSL hydrolase family protein [Planctomycetota bacterium]